MKKNVGIKGKIDARANFIDILSSTEKENKNDYAVSHLINKTKEDYKKQVLYANSKNVYLDTDIYYKRKRKSRQLKTKTLRLSNIKKPLKENHVHFNLANVAKKSYSIGNLNMLNNLNNINNINNLNKMQLKLDSSKSVIKNKILQKDFDDIKLTDEGYLTERKKYDKLDNLTTILELIDVHEKTQYQLMDEKERKKINMLRNKKKFDLYHTCLTYNKNNLFYNKKYKLIFDKNKSINKLYVHTYQNKNPKNTSPIKKNNINTLLTDTKIDNNISSNSNRLQSPINFISSKEKSDFQNKINELNDRNRLNIEITEARESIPYTNISSESNIFKTYSSTNTNSSKNKFKADIILSKRNQINNKNKQISKVYSDVLMNYNKIKNSLSNYYLSDKREENQKKINEMNIKNLIKKKRTDLKALIKELNLDYDRDNVNLEEIILNKKNKIKERIRNPKQRRLLNQIQQQVMNEEKILSKKVILENNLEKKLKSRKKKLSEKIFEEMTLKRKQLKHHLIGFKLVQEKDYINNLMKNEIPNFNAPKSLQALLYKYKVMKFN